MIKIGINFKCGCRCSMGNWFLCNAHEDMLMAELKEDDDNEELD